MLGKVQHQKLGNGRVINDKEQLCIKDKEVLVLFDTPFTCATLQGEQAFLTESNTEICNISELTPL